MKRGVSFLKIGSYLSVNRCSSATYLFDFPILPIPHYVTLRCSINIKIDFLNMYQQELIYTVIYGNKKFIYERNLNAIQFRNINETKDGLQYIEMNYMQKAEICQSIIDEVSLPSALKIYIIQTALCHILFIFSISPMQII